MVIINMLTLLDLSAEKFYSVLVIVYVEIVIIIVRIHIKNCSMYICNSCPIEIISIIVPFDIQSP